MNPFRIIKQWWAHRKWYKICGGKHSWEPWCEPKLDIELMAYRQQRYCPRCQGYEGVAFTNLKWQRFD